MAVSSNHLLVALLVCGCQSPGYGGDSIQHDRTIAPAPFTSAWPHGAAPGVTSPALSPSVALPRSSASSSAVAAPTASAPRNPLPCPSEMALIEGEFCSRVQQNCKQWMDEGSAFLPQHRCAHFEKPSKCLGERVHKRFCIDRDEFTAPGERLPANFQSWTMASTVCRSADKRLCFESEWVFACEGQEMLPYPTGYDRDATLCNFDLTELMDKKGKLVDHRKPSAELARCASPFGVRNMVGNVDEWAYREEPGVMTPFRSALKGGWWMAARNRCRPATTAHDEYYNDTQTGFRCCRDAR